jgi:multiple sugar transport system ATP-binding protein
MHAAADRIGIAGRQRIGPRVRIEGGAALAEVAIEGVTKVYPGPVTAVRDASLTVRDGEFMVLVGPSGCGKSTLLRTVAGLEEVTAGTIRIGARAVNDVAPKDRDVAMVFQDYALYPHMTVAGNLSFGLKMRRLPAAEIGSRVAEAARILGIEGLLDRRPKALSGGQRQRVALGRAIVRKPAVFLFDEPLSNLDAGLRAELRAEIKKLHGRLRTTTIYVTHDQVEAMTLGERIAVLRDGVIQQVGEPLELYDRPANRFVAGFLGTPPMNFLQGTFVRRDGGPGFTDGHARLRLPEGAAAALAGREGCPIELGIRPERLALAGSADAAGGGEDGLEARVEVVEPLGSGTIIRLATPRQALTVMVEAHRTVRVGETAWLSAPSESWHVFDGGSGQVVGAGRPDSQKR